ncbi:MAG: sigma-54 dependent transcriptional regulator, partial [Acidobacteriota bacterium]
MKMNRVLVVDDDVACLSLMELTLRGEGYNVTVARDGREALKLIEEGGIDLIVSDVQMPHLGGDMLLRSAKKKDQSIEVILVTAHSTLDAAARAVIDGAYDYLSKPFNIEELLDRVKRALEHRQAVRATKGDVAPAISEKRLVGRSRAMLELFKLIGRAAPSDSTILILGESGTGKEMIARQIHNLSHRSTKKFVAVNCGALTETLLESELFGRTKGAFTGAAGDRRGLFEEANGGTIFLDEITETSLAFQLKLLR